MHRLGAILVVLMAVPTWLQKYAYIGLGLLGAMNPMLGIGAPRSQPRLTGRKKQREYSGRARPS